MRTPSTSDRLSLDEAIAVLVRLGEDVTLDDFRTSVMQAAQRTNHRLRVIAFYGALTFLILTVAVLYTRLQTGKVDPAALGLAMGGLGAVSSILVMVLRLTPEEPFKIADEFDAVGRIVLGCVFSTILTVALYPGGASDPARIAGAKNLDVAFALAPFLFGYSIELALRVLDRAVQTLINFFGGDTRATATPRRAGRRRSRKAS